MINELSKVERKKLKEEFLDIGKTDIYRKAQRIFFIAIFGAGFAILAISMHIFVRASILNFLVDGFLLIFTLFFIYRTSLIKRHELNKFFIEKNKPKKLQL